MSKLLFLDVETSGLEIADRICEIGFILDSGENMNAYSSLCKPPKKISTEAMSLHHITNEMLKEMPVCAETDAFKVLQENNKAEQIFIAHNVNFDVEMLAKEGLIVPGELIDTLRCTKALIPECEQFSLQYLRYELGLYKEEEKTAQSLGIDLNAHRALSDAMHTMLLYRTLLEYATLSELIEISSKPVLLQKLLFGKYKGSYIEEVVDNDRAYVHWLLSLEDLDEDLAYSLKYYLQ